MEILRNVGVYGHPEDKGTHGYIRYTDVRIPADLLRSGRGDGFVVAQTRLGGGRIHHAMRTVGLVKQALDMMCERALSRTTQGETLARKQLVQAMIADSSDPARAVPAAGAAHGVAHRPEYDDYEGPRRHLGGQGGDAQGAPRRHLTPRCRSTVRSA